MNIFLIDTKMLSTLPSIRKLSAGLYSLLSRTQQDILDQVGDTRALVINGETKICDEILIQCKIHEDGLIMIQTLAYIFSNNRNDSLYPIYPNKQYLVTPIRLVPLIPIVQMNNDLLELRCSLLHRRDIVLLEDEKDIAERVAYAILNKCKMPQAMMFAFCIQGGLSPTKERITKINNISRTLNVKDTGYKSLCERRKYDTRSLEAVCAPYDVYTHELVQVDRPLATKKDTLPDTDHYLIVPPCAVPLACLMRKSIRNITEEVVNDFIYRSGTVISPEYLRDDRKWVISIKTEEEELAYNPLNTSQLLRRIGAIDNKESKSQSWDIYAIRRYLSILFSYRAKRLHN